MQHADTPELHFSAPHPVLLTCAGYFGTLAAARQMGSLGVPVTMADANALAPAMWSKHVSRREKSPVLGDVATYVHWLSEFGRRNPGHVLYPTGDETAWIFSKDQSLLEDNFKMFSPGFECIQRLLNKQQLTELCCDLGISTPETYFPNSLAQASALASSMSFPVMIKPKTQVFLKSHCKGGLVSGLDELKRVYTAFVTENTYTTEMLQQDPAIRWPMIQRYYTEAMDSIYNLSGFIDQSGELFALRASRKILQQPRRIGIGLCFEQAELEPELCKKVLTLCRRVGYFGVFEVEFIKERSTNRYLLTDFNPRYYNQMVFDIDRGLPLPAMAYCAAVGDYTRLAEMIRKSMHQDKGPEAYCYTQMFSLLLQAQQIAGNMTAPDRQAWKYWLNNHRNDLSDPLEDSGDKRPIRINTLNVMREFIRHPKGFIKGITTT